MVSVVCVALALALALALVPSIAAAQTAQPQTPKQVPKQAPVQAPTQRPQTAVVKPMSPEVLNAMRTGVGRYEVAGVDVHVQGGGLLPGLTANPQPVVGDSPNDSVIVIRGTIHAAGIADQESGKIPAGRFDIAFKGWDVFPGLAATCKYTVSGYPQTTQWGHGYVAHIAFKDTAHLQECWQYFKSMKTAALVVQAVKTNMHPAIPALPLTDGGTRTITLGPLLPRTPAP